MRTATRYGLVFAVMFALAAPLTGCSDERREQRHGAARGLDERTFASVSIADPDKALTFARTGDRLIGVREYRDGLVAGVDLSSRFGTDDPIDLFNRMGYDALVQALNTPSDIAVPADRLTFPVRLYGHHIAAATNFPEHAGEVGVKEGPFLFAKLVSPTGPRSRLPAGDALLDYEVELAWVTLAPLPEGAPLPEFMGLIAVNDFTDRDTLLHGVDPTDVASGQGFATGKSRPGYLPVGDLFVIPADYRSYAESRTLELYVNRELRQEAPVSDAIWGIDEIVAQARARKNKLWTEQIGTVSLFPKTPGVISDRTLLLVGTPPGVVFRGVTSGQKVAGFFDWLFFGWEKSIPERAIDSYVRAARSEHIYLQPGDEVAIRIDGLGTIRTTITP